MATAWKDTRMVRYLSNAHTPDWAPNATSVTTQRRQSRGSSAHTPDWAPNAPGVTTQRPQKDGTVVEYHGRELPQVSFLTRQKFCLDKHVFVATKHVVCVRQQFCRIVLSRQQTCFVATKMILVAAPANHTKNPYQFYQQQLGLVLCRQSVLGQQSSEHWT